MLSGPSGCSPASFALPPPPTLGPRLHRTPAPPHAQVREQASGKGLGTSWGWVYGEVPGPGVREPLSRFSCPRRVCALAPLRRRLQANPPRVGRAGPAGAPAPAAAPSRVTPRDARRGTLPRLTAGSRLRGRLGCQPATFTLAGFPLPGRPCLVGYSFPGKRGLHDPGPWIVRALPRPMAWDSLPSQVKLASSHGCSRNHCGNASPESPTLP